MKNWRDLKINAAPTWHDCAPDWSWAPAAMPDYDFWFVAQGRGELEFEGQTFPLSRGQFFLWRPGNLPRAIHDPQHPLRVFFCHFEPMPVWELPHDWPQFINVRDSTFFESTARRAQNLWRRDDPASREEAKRLLLSLLWLFEDEIECPPPPRDELMEKLAERLRNEFGRAWTLDEMAREVGFSRSQLARRFRARFGESAQEFLLKTRLENARNALIETDFSIERIAAQNGFFDGAHFSNAFKKWAGTTPSALRNRQKNF